MLANSTAEPNRIYFNKPEKHTPPRPPLTAIPLNRASNSRPAPRGNIDLCTLICPLHSIRASHHVSTSKTVEQSNIAPVSLFP